MSEQPQQSEDCRRVIAELNDCRPYDGRRVTIRETRGGWTWMGVSGVCTRLAEDRRHMVIIVVHDPDSYWPIGMELLAELDHESVPIFEATNPDNTVHDPDGNGRV